ncbi:MAG TPA: hypothetical protein VGF61_05315 [Candidatus Acidoferrum sp.]
MKRGVGGLRLGEIAGLQVLAELGKELLEGILGVGVRTGGTMVVMVVRGHGGRLEILLDGGVVLLGGKEIAGFEIRGELIERGDESAGRGRRKGGDIVRLNGGKV